MTDKPQRASHQPQEGQKHRRGLYPAGPEHGTDQGKVHVVLPDQPPELTPEAARALLDIIRRAYAQRFATGSPGSSPAQGGQEDDTDSDTK